MKKVIDNEIVTASSASELKVKIKELMAKGWVPVGTHQVTIVNETARISGGFTVGSNFEHEYSQSMVKYESKENDDIKIPATYDWPDSSRPLSEWSDEQLFAAGEAARKRLGGK